jgi:hypothetical protein
LPGQLPLLSPADRLSGQGNWTTDASRSFTRLVVVEFVHSSLSALGVDAALCFSSPPFTRFFLCSLGNYYALQRSAYAQLCSAPIRCTSPILLPGSRRPLTLSKAILVDPKLILNKRMRSASNPGNGIQHGSISTGGKEISNCRFILPP